MHPKVSISLNDLKIIFKILNTTQEPHTTSLCKFLSSKFFCLRKNTTQILDKKNSNRLIEIINKEVPISSYCFNTNSNYISKWYYQNYSRINFLCTENNILFCIRPKQDIIRIKQICTDMGKNEIFFNINSYYIKNFKGTLIADIIKQCTFETFLEVVKHIGYLYYSFLQNGYYPSEDIAWDTIIDINSNIVHFNLQKINKKPKPVKTTLNALLATYYINEYLSLKTKFSEHISYSIIGKKYYKEYQLMYNAFKNNSDRKDISNILKTYPLIDSTKI